MPNEKLVRDQATLTLAAARRIIAAAEAEAINNSWPVVIAVVDSGGHLLALARLDDTQTGSVEIAIQKARAAMAFKRPTKAWSDALVGGRQAVLALPGVMPTEGGVPILYQGNLVGAIGVSGVRPEQDGQIAAAGVAVVSG
jgi:uncharacterized protein GlcG (DUF336 family)